ncbi:MAG: DUF389 domain-containing protein [Thermoanaerobaculia bacterium]|nr:DUF389 domain-containing protein [Thermoanaerobaculia bacterium]
MSEPEKIVDSDDEGIRGRIARALGVDGASRDGVYRHVAHASTLRDPTYWLEILMSAGIAILGLSLDSPAVIIGAMLISPLMGPILAAGLALAAGDFVLLSRTAVNILLSSVVAVLFAMLFVAFLPFREMTGEIAARLRPTTLDLVVALLSGAVGALAISKSARGVATSIPGVAIAVALMPPLGVVGYGAGLAVTVDPRQGAEIFRGGGLLFLTNLAAIIFSAMLVFLLLHFDAPEMRGKIREGRESDPESRFIHFLILRYPIPDWLDRVGTGPVRLAIPLIFVVVLFAPLSKSLDKIKSELAERKQVTLIQQKATSLWQENFAKTLDGKPRSSILSLSSAHSTKRLELRLRVVTTAPLTLSERAMYTRLVAAAMDRDPSTIDLDLIQIPAAEATMPPLTTVEKSTSVAELVSKLESRLEPLLAQTKFPARAKVLGTALSLGGGEPVIELRYMADTALPAEASELIEENVRRLTGLTTASVHFVHVPSPFRIRFAEGSSTLPVEAAASLDAIGQAAAGKESAHVTVKFSGAARLSERRVATIRNALLEQGGLDEKQVSAETDEAIAAGEMMVVLLVP